MKSLEEHWVNSIFSHIYIEKEALDYQTTQDILNRFPDAQRILIKRYTDITNRPRQDVQLQKQSLKLILAVKRSPFLYKGPEICQDYGHANFYYASVLLNCLYDCHYCYLQGMYPSAHITAFVNVQDFFHEVDNALKEGPLYLCTSYDTDLLALESIFSYGAQWIQYGKKHPNLLIEIRTKSANYDAIASIPSSSNILLAWTLSPHEITAKYETKTPSLSARLSAASKAARDGWPIRLCLEPILSIPNWKTIYADFVDNIFKTLEASQIIDINIGMFRMNRGYFHKIQKSRVDTDLFSHPMECSDNVMSYSTEQEEEMTKFLLDKISTFYPREKIYL